MNDTIVLDTNAIISLFGGNQDIANMLNGALLRTIIRRIEKGWYADSYQRYLDSGIDH